MIPMLAKQIFSRRGNTGSPSSGNSHTSGKNPNMPASESRKKHIINHILKYRDGQAYLVSTPFRGPEDARREWTTEDFKMMESESQEMLNMASFKRIESASLRSENELDLTHFNTIRKAFERASTILYFRNFNHTVYVDSQHNRDRFPYVFEDVATDEFGNLLNCERFSNQFVQDFETLTNLGLKQNESSPEDTVEVQASRTQSDTLAGTDSPDTLSDASGEVGCTLVESN